MEDYVYDLGMDDLVQYGADQYVTGLDMSLYFQTLTSVSRLGPTLWERKPSSVIGVWS